MVESGGRLAQRRRRPGSTRRLGAAPGERRRGTSPRRGHGARPAAGPSAAARAADRSSGGGPCASPRARARSQSRRSQVVTVAASDAIVVGESWISEHFFTADAKSQTFAARVVERRKAWDAGEAGDAAAAGNPRTRFLAARSELEAALGALAESGRRSARRRGPRGPQTDRRCPRVRPGRPGRGRRPAAAAHLDAGAGRCRPAGAGRGPAGRLGRDAARQGRRHPARPLPHRGGGTDHLRGAAAVAAVRRGRRPELRAGPGRAVAAGGRAGPVGRRAATWRSTCNWSANATRSRSAARSTVP